MGLVIKIHTHYNQGQHTLRPISLSAVSPKLNFSAEEGRAFVISDNICGLV